MEASQAISCTTCGAAVDPSEVHQELRLASCGACETVFSLDDRAFAPSPPQAPSEGQAIEAHTGTPSSWEGLGDLSLPAGVEVAESPQALVIVHRWFSFSHIFLAFFALLWNGFLVVWWSIAIAQQEWGMLLFTVLHVVAGAVVGYSALTGFVNRTVITVCSGQLEVAYAPLWWPGGKVLPTAKLRQLYCQEHIQRTKNGTRITYSVEAMAPQGAIRVLGGLPRLEVARFVERRIEEHLGIEDVAMPMEVPKGRPSNRGWW